MNDWILLDNSTSERICPFCGESSVDIYKSKHNDETKIKCEWCGAEVTGSDREEALNIWNSRVGEF